jgi:hypothetical protein
MVSRLRYGRPIFAALVVLILAGLYFAAGAGHHAAAAAHAGRPVRVTVSTAQRVCAAPGSAAPTKGGVAVTAVPGSSASGSAAITPLEPGGSSSPGAAATTLTKPGVLAVMGVRTAASLTPAEQAGQAGSSPGVTTQAGRGGVEVSATGAMAQGLEVEQTGPGGLVTAQCTAPGTNIWFLGPGQQSAATIELYLMNTGSQAADAQVSLLTDVTKGPPLLGNADNGITVPPHSMVVQQLGHLLQSSKVVALNVTTSVGQVAAAVRESRSASDDGNWLPVTTAPARHLVIPGLPGNSGSRDLYVAVPGSASAQVKITAVTAKGSYQPTGGTGIDLLGGSAVSIALPSMSGVHGAITVSSSEPVVATILAPGGPAGTPGAVAASTGPVMEQGVVADNPARSAGSTELVLSAPGKAASVRVTTATSAVPATGQQGTVVQIKARSSVVLPVEPPAGSRATAFSLIVTPLAGSGPVYAARIINSGGVQSILPVPSSPTWIPLPSVQDSLAAILG